MKDVGETTIEEIYKVKTRGYQQGELKRDVILVAPVGSGGCTVERRTINRGDGGSIPPTAVSKIWQFLSPHICLCLLEETLKAGGLDVLNTSSIH